MKEKSKWFCPSCEKFVENPKTGSYNLGQMSCPDCQGYLLEGEEQNE